MLFMRSVSIHLAHILAESKAMNAVQSSQVHEYIEKEVVMCACEIRDIGAKDVIGFDAFAHKLFVDNTVNMPE